MPPREPVQPPVPDVLSRGLTDDRAERPGERRVVGIGGEGRTTPGCRVDPCLDQRGVVGGVGGAVQEPQATLLVDEHGTRRAHARVRACDGAAQGTVIELAPP